MMCDVAFVVGELLAFCDLWALRHTIAMSSGPVSSLTKILNWRRENPVWSNYTETTAMSPAKEQLMAAIAGPFGRRGAAVGVRAPVRIGAVRR